MPSSSYLSRLIIRSISPRAHVLELGPGTGPITQALKNRLEHVDQLTLIEVDPDLARLCRQRFSGARILTGDAVELLAQEKQKFDAIVSGIPFVLMEPNVRQSFFQLVADHLTPNGEFILFQYSLTTKRELKRIFDKVDISFTPWNLPPAFVYRAYHPRNQQTEKTPTEQRHTDQTT